MKINNYAIELMDDWQPPYSSIYSQGLVKLETLKTYIKNNLVSSFIRLFKFFARVLIFFDKKPNKNLRLYVDYQGFNNLTIKNRYPLSLVGELLDWLGQAWHFTQLDLTNAYHQMQIREKNEWKTAFKICYGHFKYQVMLFGLINAPTIFQSYINKTLVEKFDVFMIIYLDNIFIYTKNKGKKHVKAV